MEAGETYAGIEKEIYRLKEKLPERDFQMYELDFLRRVAARAAGFCPDCDACQGSLNAISGLVKDAADPSGMRSATLKNYSTQFRRIVKHLEERHGMVRRGLIINSLLKGMLLGVLPGTAATIVGVLMEDDVIVAVGFGAFSAGLVLGIWLGIRAGRRRSNEAEAGDRFI